MNNYLEAMFNAYMAGYHVPELIDVYFHHDYFRTPHAYAMDFLL